MLEDLSDLGYYSFDSSDSNNFSGPNRAVGSGCLSVCRNNNFWTNSWAHANEPPKQHFDLFSHFCKTRGVLNIQPNRQTYRPRYCVCSNRPPSVLCCGLKITKVAVVVVKLKACVIGLYLRRIWRVFRCETNGKLAYRYHSKTTSTWSRDARTRLSCTRTRFLGLRTRLFEGGPRLS